MRDARRGRSRRGLLGAAAVDNVSKVSFASVASALAPCDAGIALARGMERHTWLPYSILVAARSLFFFSLSERQLVHARCRSGPRGARLASPSHVAHRGNLEVIRNMASRFNSFIQEFELTNDRRISHFLGQCAIESAW